ncbi:MAG: biotin--[acetyl-CoA-carboxylase] ligase [Calditrichaeota bacterium]|nr:MAG: biotin--[acetyl-CoA-carboxylase] ligase [Calditrichota bacterium]
MNKANENHHVSLPAFDAQAISDAITNLAFFNECHVFMSVGSTNDTLKRMAASGAPNGTVLIADSQTKGRGRFGRQWVSPPGKGLWFSILIKPGEISTNRWHLLPMVLGEIIVLNLNKLTPVQFHVKWPNDILFNKQKVCGILCESVSSRHAFDYIVAGIGINVNNNRPEFPPALQGTATSVKLAIGHEMQRTDLLLDLMRDIGEKLHQIFVNQQVLSVNYWRDHCLDFNKNVQIRAGKKIHTGKFIDISDDGGLVLETENQQRMIIPYGEATLMKEKR